MYNYNIDYEFLGELGIIFIFFAIVLGIISILLYVFGALGIMEVAKKNKMPNPWLAFIPVANSYLVGKIGFEIYSDEANKNTTFPWAMLGLSAGMIIINSESELYGLLNIALLVFSIMSYYRIYKYLTPKYKMYTVLSFFFGGLPLFINKEMIKPKEDNLVKDTKVFEEKNSQSTENDSIKKEQSERPIYCSSCGNKLNKTAKFCPNCGKKIIE